MNQYDYVMRILSDPTRFPEEIFSALKKMAFETGRTEKFFERLCSLIIERITSKDAMAADSGVRRLFISKDYEEEWLKDIKK